MQNGESYSRIWNGILRFNELSIPNVDMNSAFKETTKPFLLGEILQVEELIPWTDCIQQQPICELASSADLCKRLTECPCVEVKVRKLGTIQYFYVSYFTVSRPGSNTFIQIHNSLSRAQVAGFSILPGGSILLLIPNGDLSTLLTLPSNAEFPAFHCMVISLGPKLEKDCSNFHQINSARLFEPKENELVDSHPKTLAMVAEFNAEWANEVHGSESPNRLLEAPSASSGYLGGPSISQPPPQHPLPLMKIPAYRPGGGGGGLPMRKTDEIPGGSGVYRPVLLGQAGFSQAHRGERVAESSSASDRDKNRALFQQTFQSVKNVGKEMPATSSSTAKNGPVGTSEVGKMEVKNNNAGVGLPSLPPGILRDPRLRRIANSDPRSVQKIMGLESPKHVSIQETPSPPITNHSPYSPTQSVRTMSPVSVSDVTSTDTPVKTSRALSGVKTSTPIVNIPLERIQSHGSGNVTPSKFFGDLSAIAANDSMNPLTGITGSFVTSTPKSMDLHSNARTGLKFDILNFNARENETSERKPTPPPKLASFYSPSVSRKSTADDDTTLVAPSKKSNDDMDDDEDPQLCIADEDEPSSPQCRPNNGDSTTTKSPLASVGPPEKKDKSKTDNPSNNADPTEEPMDMSISDSDLRELQKKEPNNGKNQVELKSELKKEVGADNVKEKAKEGFGGRLSPFDVKAALPPPGVVSRPRVASAPNNSGGASRMRPTLLNMPPPFMPIPPGFPMPMTSYPSTPTMYPDAGFYGFPPMWGMPPPFHMMPPFMNMNGGIMPKDDINPDKEREFAQQAVSVLNRSPPKGATIPTESIPIPSATPSPAPSTAARTDNKTNHVHFKLQNSNASDSTATPSTLKQNNSSLLSSLKRQPASFIQPGIPFLPDDADSST